MANVMANENGESKMGESKAMRKALRRRRELVLVYAMGGLATVIVAAFYALAG